MILSKLSINNPKKIFEKNINHSFSRNKIRYAVAKNLYKRLIEHTFKSIENWNPNNDFNEYKIEESLKQFIKQYEED